jgi:hypothetical protein
VETFFLRFVQREVEPGIKSGAIYPQKMPQEDFALQGCVFDAAVRQNVAGAD